MMPAQWISGLAALISLRKPCNSIECSATRATTALRPVDPASIGMAQAAFGYMRGARTPADPALPKAATAIITSPAKPPTDTDKRSLPDFLT